MNYRHIYHAGNFADVFKHIMLALAIDHLKQKDKLFFALDTHAGIGLYDLQSVEAQKTKEYEAGIERMWARADAPDEIKKYLAVIKTMNKDGALRFYPGSPLIMQEMMRPGDRITVNEKHPEDYAALRRNIKGDRRVRVENMDGYTLLRSALPPHERRGLVLCDPPFEVTNEFDLMLKGLQEAYERWPTGLYMFWYPVKDIAAVKRFHAGLAAVDIPKITAIEFFREKAPARDIFAGTGLAIINPPWTLAEQADRILPWLVSVLTDGLGDYEIMEVAGEK